MGFICGVLLMYMGEDDALLTCCWSLPNFTACRRGEVLVSHLAVSEYLTIKCLESWPHQLFAGFIARLFSCSYPCLKIIEWLVYSCGTPQWQKHDMRWSCKWLLTLSFFNASNFNFLVRSQSSVDGVLSIQTQRVSMCFDVEAKPAAFEQILFPTAKASGDEFVGILAETDFGTLGFSWYMTSGLKQRHQISN